MGVHSGKGRKIWHVVMSSTLSKDDNADNDETNDETNDTKIGPCRPELICN